MSTTGSGQPKTDDNLQKQISHMFVVSKFNVVTNIQHSKMLNKFCSVLKVKVCPVILQHIDGLNSIYFKAFEWVGTV